MTTAKKPVGATKPRARRAAAAFAMSAGRLTSGRTSSKNSGVSAGNLAGSVLSRSSARIQPVLAMKLTVEVDPLVDVVRRHVRLSPSLAKVIKSDFMRLFQNPTLGTARPPDRAAPAADADPVLSTQEAADLVGVSRPYIVARIEARDIPLHQQVGNQRRVLKSAVLDWHRREQARRRRALGQLGAELDSEIFAG